MHSIVVPFFKLVKQTIHNSISSLPPEFRYFLDLDTLAGYPTMKDREMSDDPQQWLSSPDLTQYDRTWWAESFKTTYSESVKFIPTRVLSLREFTLNRWMWVTDGATKFSKLKLNNELVKTKLGAAVSLSDSELLNLVYASHKVNHNDNFIGVFIKPDEKGYKRRLIANVPLGFYIVASYIRYVFDQFTGPQPTYMKLETSIADTINLTDLLKQRKVVYPLDESAYDYHVTSESWYGFLDFLDSLDIDQDARYLFKNYFGHAIWSFEGKKGIWKAGMPSGLALTSYLNSWMNYIKQRTIVNGYLNWSAGDDVLSIPYKQDLTLEHIEKEYKKFGSVANAVKNWKSYRYAEYLKRIYSPNGTSGYPARVFSSLIWAGTERYFLPSDRLPELFELFKQFFDRLGIPMPEKYVAADLSRAISSKIQNFNVRTAMEYIHAPKIHGGMGKLPYNNCTFTWNVSNVTSYHYENANIRMPRVLKYYGKITLTKGTYKNNPNISYKLGSTYTLPKITNIHEWEARLNREDIDYKGPFSNLILDTIPLPTVDFISTNFMSQFASTYHFNSFPNLTGKWNSIANRLINASIALVKLINSNRYTYHLVTLV